MTSLFFCLLPFGFLFPFVARPLTKLVYGMLHLIFHMAHTPTSCSEMRLIFVSWTLWASSLTLSFWFQIWNSLSLIILFRWIFLFSARPFPFGWMIVLLDEPGRACPFQWQSLASVRKSQHNHFIMLVFHEHFFSVSLSLTHTHAPSDLLALIKNKFDAIEEYVCECETVYKS